MIERRIEVVGIDGSRVLIRTLAGCNGCSGCGGRCGLMRDLLHDRTRSVAVSRFPHPPRAGESWAARCDERALLGAAMRGYGLALVGLVSGAVFGHYAAVFLDAPRDATTAVTAVLGMLVALRCFRQGPRLPMQLQRIDPEDA